MAFHLENLAPLAAHLPLLAMILLTIHFGLHVDLRRRHRLAKKALDRVRAERNALGFRVFLLSNFRPAVMIAAPAIRVADEFRTHGADSAVNDELVMR